jgi:hypothetical protein
VVPTLRVCPSTNAAVLNPFYQPAIFAQSDELP